MNLRLKTVDNLTSFKIFSFLEKKELEFFQKYLFQRTYKKNQILFMEGDPRERFYFLVDGYVKLEKTNSEATLLYLDYVKSYDIFPIGGIFQDHFYHYSALALTDIIVYYIPTKIFEETIRSNKKLLFYIIKRMSKIMEHHENRLQMVTTNNVQERVERSIAYLIKYYGTQQENNIVIDIPMTLTEIAKLSGSSRETVSHVFKDLKKDKILSNESKNIMIYDPDYFFQKSL